MDINLTLKYFLGKSTTKTYLLKKGRVKPTF